MGLGIGTCSLHLSYTMRQALKIGMLHRLTVVIQSSVLCHVILAFLSPIT